ncbi:N-acyl-L-amino-acid amidohydrolase [Dictyocaulus viviparus]|uniref:N-acyl-L-amino-acid amidohydrolase n=1 Tax=Dictyocaulus viviparus TaxID=29172 RepID=A0A0D8XWL6_DICVI|nr:N-acyl-L-amino-acid amidohydrolase [Dictyocaulus viviparus]
MSECNASDSSDNEDIAVTKFREYLRIKTEQPTPDYEACKEFLFKLAGELGIETKAVEVVPGKPFIIMTIPEACKEFLFKLAGELGIETKAVEVVPGKPFIIMTIPGSNPGLPSIVLYSHTDVVPAFTDKWTYPPYSGHKDKNGLIYGRGAQDMKALDHNILRTIRKHFSKRKTSMDQNNSFSIWVQLNENLTRRYDEEVGSADGMAKFVKTEHFRQLNIGFWLDEGQASENYAFKVYYAEKNQWWLKVVCEGTPGHGSKFIKNTASEKMLSFIQSALAFREKQHDLYKNDANKKLSDVITLNLTKVEGGQAVNVLPTQFTIYLDIRLPPTADFDKMEAQINEWCKKAGSGVTYEYLMVSESDEGKNLVRQKSTNKQLTPTDKNDPYWAAFHKALQKEKCSYEKEIFTGGTDSRFLRQV